MVVARDAAERLTEHCGARISLESGHDQCGMENGRRAQASSLAR